VKIAMTMTPRALLLAAALTVAGCEPAYIPTIAPKDAAFEVTCAGSCGAEGREPGVLIDVAYVGQSRQFALCCDEVPVLRARLATIADFWCEGLPVGDKRVGDLLVGTTESEATGKRGATLDQGDGYVAFNCGDWLEKLVAQLGSTSCCAGSGPAPDES
jgi:hypothetical protein